MKLSPIIEMKNISYQYPDGTKTLKNISLKIDHRKKIALLGNNGAGKSTLFLHLNGILKPTSGSLYFDGVPISYKRKEMKKLKQAVGLVLQDPDSQLFSSTVYEDIAFGPRNLGLSKEEVDQIVNQTMSDTETDQLKDKPPHLLSIGQKKRVAIAGVVAMQPQLIVLDEPTAGLDPYYVKRIIGVLDDLHAQGKTILLSTHNVDLAFQWADEILIMNEGEIISQGLPETVFMNEEILNRSHLDKPWIVEVYEQIQQSSHHKHQPFPKSKKELYSLITERR
ncbi:energy-coupling factor ABC transporter ATP-binding protein [Bacillus solimangrovi]|uniref:ABC transporter ATP-binding protein n=1 Tax=Bacillus solimangrovi TaxID=1305675 RepID=A0A1E5LGC2_9BACI|nr:ATP-binding cassette domain-containing protein [Bacillus solimangrovi]OEH93129.1 energy-coupling factor ABC transporter ATP-binding protein [Bacillus solimangrovi]